ncbi:hypothetical protein M6B38_390945 [Iris pallida]|uniref:Uncharacterized protein n=1 Tax=Iris pallida TaxID=29817 RepID=A0AAX6FZ68_IRIPA|nr:hypothetical protein M6B38_390945 [Iris pallida]
MVLDLGHEQPTIEVGSGLWTVVPTTRPRRRSGLRRWRKSREGSDSSNFEESVRNSKRCTKLEEARTIF